MTIAKQIKWDFKANGDLEIPDKNDNLIYYEDSTGFWTKYEYDSKNNQIYFEISSGFWEKMEYDSEGNKLYYENSNGYWSKYEYDSEGNKIYYEDSDGQIVDHRPKPSVVEIDGVKYKLIKL